MFTLEPLKEIWNRLPLHEKIESFMQLPRGLDNEFFLSLRPEEQSELLLALKSSERKIWFRLLAPDEIAAVLRNTSNEQQKILSHELDQNTKHEVTAILAYDEDEAGGLMNPRFARLRPDMSVHEALSYLRIQAHHNLETMRYLYVLDSTQKLLGVISLKTLFLQHDTAIISEIMRTKLITVNEKDSDKILQKRFKEYKVMALPVVDSDGNMKGIVTVDDMLTVAEQNTTEDIHLMGGMEGLDSAYFHTSFLQMIQKRGGWLTILFVGEMFTATAMGYFEAEISKAVVLALFIPLIISSGGNSGSQASTLVVRAIALGEVKLKDWLLVLKKEIFVGFALGALLGSIGFVRIMLWPNRVALYGPHYALVALTVALSLVGIVLWGSVSGSMLPFLLRKAGLDPASASAPFVATLVDVSGLIIYFSMANLLLKGVLL